MSEFLEDTRVGWKSPVMAVIKPLESEGEALEGEEGGRGPP